MNKIGIFGVLFLTPILLMVNSRAQDKAHISQIRLLQIQGKSRGLVHALRWSESSCEASRGMEDLDNLKWEKVSELPCQNVQKFIEKNRDSLNIEKLQGAKLRFTGPGPIGVVLYNDMNFLADLANWETCDAKMKNCKAPNLSTASKLAKILKESISTEWDKD